MAITTNKQLRNGAVATYVRIKEVNNKKLINQPTVVEPAEIILPSMKMQSEVSTSSIFVDLWLDQETRELAKEGGNQVPLQTIIYNSDEIFEDLPSVYEYLKTLEDFSGSVDC